MKNKPVKHKSSNKFRFVPFAERINSIDVRHAALYHIEHAYTEQPEENETYFHLALRKWHVLNLTENFKKFNKEVFGVITVQQLFHQKQAVLDALEKYLKLEDPLCLQPLLEILVSLAKDLRDEFYPDFPRFLDILIKLLKTKDADRLEWTLVCLAFLFKILRPYLKKDIALVLGKIIPLLSDTQPPYINNFAVESFAFVARDIRDQKKFITHVLNYLMENEDAIVGFGHLLFEVINGVKGKFHSCVEVFLPTVFEHLMEYKEHQDIMFRVLTQTFEDCLQSIIYKEFDVFWKSVIEYTQNILKKGKGENMSLEYILRLAGQVIEHQKGKYLTNPQKFVYLLIQVIDYTSSESTLEVCAQIGAVLLLSPRILLPQEHAGVLVKVLLPLPYPNILINFVLNTLDYAQFEMRILPAFINFVVVSKFDKDSISTLAKICLKKSPLSLNGTRIFEWVKYPIKFRNCLPLFMEYLKNILNQEITDMSDQCTNLMALLVIMPHIEKIEVDTCVDLLSKLISKHLIALEDYNIENVSKEYNLHCDTSSNAKIARRHLFIIANAIESALHITSCKKLNVICHIDTFLSKVLPFVTSPSFLPALHVLDLYLTAYEQDEGLKYTHMLLIDTYLKDCLSSPFHIVRLLTTHIYKLFENTEELKKTIEIGGYNEKLSIFSMCHTVESIDPTIQEYRTQLNLLQKMAFNSIQYNIAKHTDFYLYPLNYMLGVLYMNFKLLWEPVTELIASYGNALTNEFWPLFYKSLQFSFNNVKCNIKQFNFEDDTVCNSEFVKTMMNDYCNISERLDFYNYRNLLLKTMTSCIQVCEAKNRDVVTLFLKFIDEEYRKNDRENAIKVDVERHNKLSDDNVEMDIEKSEKEIDAGELEMKETSVDEIEISEEENESVSGKVVFKTLINVMQVMAHFKNPRGLYKEPTFWELYMEFLKHKNSKLQKYSLDCVLNYKIKSITTYKDNLYNLIDDNKFKNELATFTITKDSQDIYLEDRDHVIPIILRILYGKMTTKLVSEKKGGGQTRRAMVMRYLAGCNQNELRLFIEMAFPLFKSYMAMSPKEVFQNVSKNFDIKVTLSPSKLQSTLNLFEVIREYLGGYLDHEVLRDFFKILYAICTTFAIVLAHNNVHVGYLKVMKNLRQLTLTVLRKIFDQIDKYPWEKDEVQIIFDTLISPMLSRLSTEGIYSPTNLLRLFNVWCQNPRYYILLVTTAVESDSVCPLSAMFKLLLAPKCNPVVINFILDMIEKLLTLTIDENDQELPLIQTLNITCDLNIEKDINFGSKILVPYIPDILKIMKRRFANSSKTNAVNKRDLLILSRVTELVQIPEICDELLHLLLPILVKKVCMNMSEDNMEYAVTAIINLLNHSSNPQTYIKHIAILFYKVSLVNVRKLLLKLLSTIAESETKNKEVLTRIANVIGEINAYNKRFIEQLDVQRILDAFKQVYSLSEDNQIDVNFAILIVNNCFYFIRSEKELGNTAMQCLEAILPKLLKRYWSTTEGQFLVKDTVLSLISNGIRDNKNAEFRKECITLLGVLARECPEADVILGDLSNLTNKEDRELDFFDNIISLQLQRQVQALHRFCKVSKNMTKYPSARTLTNFILPMATTYLFNDTYTSKNSLIDVCIDVISTCCRLLPWYHYEIILKLYLNKMRHCSDYQKQLTRIITGILDSFHFDFSKVRDIELPKTLITNIDTGKFKITLNTDVEEHEELEDKNKSNLINADVKEDNCNDENLKSDEMADASILEKSDKEEKDIESAFKNADEELENDIEDSKEVNTIAYERMTHVSPSVAKRIIKSLSSGLLPQLNRTIGRMTDYEGSHKVNRRHTSIERQEEDMLRVPIALALVKLLQKLPGELLSSQLPGIIIKLCSFLKSPLKQVRINARDIVKKVMITVGTKYLGVLLEHLTLLLTRGFQVHVLVATIHTVLDALKLKFNPGELDKCLTYILDVCTNNLFGSLADEKEVDKLHYKTPEAKPSKKSYVTLTIVAQNVTESSLVNLILPFKEVLMKHHSKKITLKAQEALKHIASGLVVNKFIEIESLFVFLYGIASESIPEFVLSAPKREITESQREKMLRAKPDCFIIPEIPKRNREVQAKYVKTSSKANGHILIEFSLNLLYVILKREIVSRMDCRAFVDPIVPLLVDALKSDHVRVTTVALKCISTLWTIRVSTPSLEEMIADIVQYIFSILHKYATAEISTHNDNYNLVRVSFKAITVLVRNVKYYTLNVEQLKTLLLYAEEDCQNDEKQPNSFSLLKAILEAKLLAPELHEVMEKVSKICILSESAKSREEARLIFVMYLTTYSLAKKLEKYLQFFLAQLNFELQHGRESSLKFLLMVINKLPTAQLSKQSDYLLITLGLSMMNDASPECRACAADCIEAMLKRLRTLHRNKLFDLVLKFFKDNMPVHWELAAQLGVRFVNVEQSEFKSRLDTVLPLVKGKLLLLSNDNDVGKFVRISIVQSEDQTSEEKQMEIYHCLIQTLYFIDKIMFHCTSTLNISKYFSDYDEIGQYCQEFLAHPHAWVRLRAVQVLKHIIGSVDPQHLDSVVQKKVETDRGFIYHETEEFLRSLVLDLCAQYAPNVSKDMADEVTGVMFKILGLVHSMSSFKSRSKEENANDGDYEYSGRVNMRWILFRLRQAINVEVVRAPHSTVIRISIFTMLKHVIGTLTTEDILEVIEVIIPPVARELSTPETDAPVRQVAARVGTKLRKKIGDIEYAKLIADAQMKLNIKRAERKKLVLQEKVNNPEKAAKRKLVVKEKKKQAKKIKLDMVHGKRPRTKKRKIVDDEPDHTIDF